MAYHIWNPYELRERDSPEDEARSRERLRQRREIIRAMLPRLREVIEDPDRDPESVFQTLRPYYLETGEVPMTPTDLPELEVLCQLILERGGSGQSDIQRVLLRLIGATAASESVLFLLEMLYYSKRGDQFGPERRQLSLWGLARVAILHDVPEAYEALREGSDDHRADVRLTTADLILDTYLDKHSTPTRCAAGCRRQAARDGPVRTGRLHPPHDQEVPARALGAGHVDVGKDGAPRRATKSGN